MKERLLALAILLVFWGVVAVTVARREFHVAAPHSASDSAEASR